MPEIRDQTDVVLVGMGAAGGIAAHVLTEAGLSVVGLEAGPRLTTADYALDELRNDMRGYLAQPKSVHEVPTWRNGSESEAVPSPWPMLMVNGIGGATVHYGGLSIRFAPWAFRAKSETIAKYGPTAVPAEATIEDWPVTYDELEPYYDSVEYAIGISGAAGTNPFEGTRARPYPMPPLRPSGWSRMMHQAADTLGWHPFPAPTAINSEPYDGRPECTYCGFCQYNGCYCDAKGSTDVNVIRRAERTGRLRIETSAVVVRVDTDDQGRASGVTYIKDGRQHFQPASVVLIGGFTYENVRLLLMSKSRAYPAGLANNSGQVGRHYMPHVMGLMFGLFPGKRLNVFNGTGCQATCVDDFNADNFDHDGLGFIGGGMMVALHEMTPINFAARVPLPPGVPRWGTAWKAWLRRNAQSVGRVIFQFDTLSYEGNCLDLDPTARDQRGMPKIRITHRLGDNEMRGYEFYTEKMKKWLSAAGASQSWESGMFLDGRHGYGGTRMGTDPRSSVVNRWGLTHEVPNLGLLGASTFPTSTGHNPTLTVQAQTWRTAEHVSKDWRRVAAK